MIDDYRMSADFRVHEFLESEKARELGVEDVQFNPPAHVIGNLQHLVDTTLQPLRHLLQVPIYITSGYRCAEVNEAVGGSATSQHRVGEAADIVIDEELLSAQASSPVRRYIEQIVQSYSDLRNGVPPKANANQWAWTLVAYHRDLFDIDQGIHEFGQVWAPKWLHLAASKGKRNKRELKRIGAETDNTYVEWDLRRALLAGSEARPGMRKMEA